MDTNRALGEKFSRYVGEQLRGEAAMRGITTTALARTMNIDRVTLHRYLTGKRALPVPVLYDAAEAIGLPAALIVTRADERMSAEHDYVLAASDDDSLQTEDEALSDEP